MLITKTVMIKWNSKIKKHYVDLGYEFTKMKDNFAVNVNDLTDGSAAMVDVECDYCKNVYQKHWCNYILENKKSLIHKDCCKLCRKKKIQESSMTKYGVPSVFCLDEVKNKIKETNLEKYGCENPFESEEIKSKIANTNIKKYGVRVPTQNPEIYEKVIQTCLEKYGVKSFVMTQIKYGEDNPCWKGGVEYHRNERATREYIDWRKQVFSKNQYTCQCCGDKSGKGHSVRIEAHHIFNWNDNINLRYDVSNGITLCRDCHIVFHMIYGKENNTDLQLKEFLFEYGKKIC